MTVPIELTPPLTRQDLARQDLARLLAPLRHPLARPLGAFAVLLDRKSVV